MAARLAEQGFTASPDAIEHPQGLLNAVSPGGDAQRGPVDLGKRWMLEVRGLDIKKYPLCYCAHRAIDSLLALRRTHALDPEDIERITVEIGRRHATVLRNHAPKTGLEAKFSGEFAVAAAAIRGRVSLKELTDEFVGQTDVQEMMQRVQIEIRPDDDPDTANQPRSERVVVTLRSGEVLDGPEIRHARGHAEAPLTHGELFEKFAACIDHGGADDVDAAALFGRLMQLDKDPARSLMAAGRVALDGCHAM